MKPSHTAMSAGNAGPIPDPETMDYSDTLAGQCRVCLQPLDTSPTPRHGKSVAFWLRVLLVNVSSVALLPMAPTLTPGFLARRHLDPRHALDVGERSVLIP